ncbi:tetratricopeptide repeat protein [Trichloromonas sp.]|uniref:tetratricopeptide repeat protein n=1 Tax=Trichloromonas sp. TaxID=3069249 RepID=UPI003D817D4C
MSARFGLVLLAVLILPAYGWLNRHVWDQRAVVRSSTEAGYIIPSRFTRLMALEHKGILSDFQLLKTITFYGERTMHQQKLTEDDWRYIIAGLEAVTDLDPYFLDPYVLAEGVLAWDAGKVEDANRLLEKGRKHRVDDWQIPFFIGFNSFYFLEDYTKGAEYLMEASRLPGSPEFLTPLAARLGYYGGKAKTAIMFLRGVLTQTSDERLKLRLEKRLLALERADLIEEAVERFKSEKDRMPDNIKEVLEAGYLETLPVDPYGGEWVIMKFGRVFSTSKFVDHLPRKDD